MSNVTPDYIEVASDLGSRRLHLLRTILVPMTLPGIRTAFDRLRDLGMRLFPGAQDVDDLHLGFRQTDGERQFAVGGQAIALVGA